VIVQGVAGGALPQSGILGGHGDVLGGRGVAGRVSARWGRARGPARRRPSIGGRRQRWWSKQKGGKRVLAGWPRAPPLSLDANQIGQESISWQDFVLAKIIS
jgi:hypothetical protein